MARPGPGCSAFLTGKASRRFDAGAARETGLMAALIYIQLRRDRKYLAVIGLDKLPAPLVDHPVMPVAKKN